MDEWMNGVVLVVVDLYQTQRVWGSGDLDVAKTIEEDGVDTNTMCKTCRGKYSGGGWDMIQDWGTRPGQVTQ